MQDTLEKIQPHYARHRNKIIDQEFCNPLGKVAIITPLVTRYARERKAAKELACYNKDAQKTGDQLREMGAATEDVRGAGINDITQLLQDENVRGLYLIGNGCYSGIDTDDGLYDWSLASVNTGDLKEFVVQKTCGITTNQGANLPFGVFAVSDQTQIVAPNYGRWIPDEDPGDEFFFQPYNQWNNTPQDLVDVDTRLQAIQGSHGLECGTLTLSLVNFLANILKRPKE